MPAPHLDFNDTANIRKMAKKVIDDYDLNHFRTELNYGTLRRWGFTIKWPMIGVGITPFQIRAAIIEKWEGLADHWIQQLYGDILKMEWVRRQDENGNTRECWVICNVKRSDNLN